MTMWTREELLQAHEPRRNGDGPGISAREPTCQSGSSPMRRWSTWQIDLLVVVSVVAAVVILEYFSYRYATRET